jgi:hypothetical protein
VILEDVVVDGEERHIEVVGVDFVIHAELLQDAVVDGEERRGQACMRARTRGRRAEKGRG